MSRQLQRRGVYRPPPWTPFLRAEHVPVSDKVIAETAKKFGYTVEATRAAFAIRVREDELWKNSRYQVAINRTVETGKDWPPLIHLSIKRLDREPIHDWRDLQRIKNELVGPEHEAVELYPAESRLTDTSNQYHLWVLAAPDARFPFGFSGGRNVMQGSNGKSRQRPFEQEDRG